MADIVERLRAPAYWMSGSNEGHEGENDAPREAADEITRLTARVKGLEKALARQCDNMAFIVNHVTMPEKWLHKWERELAEDRVALTTNTERTA